MSETRNLSICGQTVPFDGAPRFAEVEAYDAALKEGGDVWTLIRHVAPVIVNTRLRPSAPFILEAHTPVDEGTALGVLAVVEAIQGALQSPKVKAALTGMTPKQSR